MTPAPDAAPAPRPAGAPGEVFRAFLKLGLTAFGGPVAHLGYFRADLVARRGWVGEAAYADLVALCQFLPGPTSSQVGFALGWLRAGPPGALAAWVAFTLPSAMALALFAAGADHVGGPVGEGLLHGLKLAAVAVVAQAVASMARTLTPDMVRAGIALGAGLIVAALPSAPAQPAAIVLGALAGLRLCRQAAAAPEGAPGIGVPLRTGRAALALFAAIPLVAILVCAATGSAAAGLFLAFYRVGALVFGGGHVVLPLLEAETVRPGLIGADAFLAGYAAAQAVPGPLFTFAAYLGARIAPGGPAGAVLALAAIFLPGLLLVVGLLPFRDRLRGSAAAQAAMRGANAAVVGLLAAALLGPVRAGAIASVADLLAALAAVLALAVARLPPWLVVTLTALAGLALARL